MKLRLRRVTIDSNNAFIDKKPGAPPAKDDKGKKAEEMSQEEKDRAEKELKAKEDKEAEFGRWWESHTEQERFQLFFEDKFREPRVNFVSPA